MVITMATLLEKLKNRQVNTATVQPIVGETEAAAKLLQAKTGKAAPIGQPIGIEGERAARQQIQAQVQPLQQAATLQAVQTGQQTEQIAKEQATQTAQIGQAGRELESKKEQQIKNIEQLAANEADKLKVNKEQAQSEARLFAKRMSSEKYVQDLQKEATLNRLTDKTSFDEYITSQTFGNAISDLFKNQEYEQIFQDNSRSWNERMAALDVESLLDLAKLEASTAAQRQQWEAIGGVGTAVAEAVPSNSKTTTTTETLPAAIDGVPA